MTHKFAVGDIVRVTSNKTAHCHDIGAVVKLTEECRGQSFRGNNMTRGWLIPSEMELIMPEQTVPEPWSIFNNREAHGLLTDVHRAELQAWDGGIEVFTGFSWSKRATPLWGYTVIYRAIPKPALTPDIIPWAAMLPEWKWAARDDDGDVFAFTHEPLIEVCVWYCEHGDHGDYTRIDNVLPGVIVGTVDWKDSLQKRPENV